VRVSALPGTRVPCGGCYRDDPLYTPPEPRATLPPLQGAALELARDQHILDRFKEDVRRRGVVGEETTAATVKLSIDSRLLGLRASPCR
jgi:hypothetical protein